MCSHEWAEVNDVRVCKKCGLTIDKSSGKILVFDRKITGIKNKRRKGRKP